MEEEKYTVYDLETSQDPECGGREISAPHSEAHEETACGDKEISATCSEAQTELTRMVEEMGSE